MIKHTRNIRLICAGAHHVAGDALAQQGVDGVNDNGFTRAGLTRQGGQTGTKGDVRFLNHRHIFNM